MPRYWFSWLCEGRVKTKPCVCLAFSLICVKIYIIHNLYNIIQPLYTICLLALQSGLDRLYLGF